MKHWINKNYKTLIIAAFLIPIITVAIVSISHVTKWYGISNPVSWAIYLSIGIEIAALSALAAISADMGKKVYFPFAIVTLVQFIGNIFFAYSYIDIDSKSFKDWVDLVSPLVSFMGVEATDFVGHKRFLAFFAGGMLPVISLSFLHMLVKFTEEDRMKEIENDIDKKIQDNVPAADIADEINRLKLSQRDLEILEKFLLNPNPPNEALKKAAENYKKTLTKEERGEILSEMMQKDQELGLYDEPFDNQIIKNQEDVIKNETTEEISQNVKPYQVQIDKINQMLSEVEDETFSEEPTTLNPEEVITTQLNELINDVDNLEPRTEFVPALGDDEVREMFMDEWERKFDLVEEEEPERQFYIDDNMEPNEIIPSQEEEDLNFNSAVTENNVQDSGDFDGFTSESSAAPEEVEKFNIDSFVDVQQPEEINDDSFWRDHIEEDDDDLKKKQ